MSLFMVFSWQCVCVKTNISVQFGCGIGAILALSTLNTWHSSSLQQLCEKCLHPREGHNTFPEQGITWYLSTKKTHS